MYNLRQQAVGPDSEKRKSLEEKEAEKKKYSKILTMVLSECEIIDNLIFSEYFLYFSFFYNMHNAYNIFALKC